ncbi:PAS domain S-box protein [Phormidium sp. LEGE 05292]|uniref:PAS domain S-box protein n=1 Tax=[Phormidium] sp. LEGE 05292 TaxID=767427 RepID=UPI00187FF5CF|nr:PAS domain S-box protein [Phormidium sp. LEGE 05292]MBE9226050.1 PAS domain S-box protein [Phormidium sp. LEGE 05292]
MYQNLLPFMVAIASTVIALLLTLWLKSLLYPLISSFFYLAIILSTWYGGFRPGFVAVVISTLAIDYFFIPPLNHIGSLQLESLLRLGVFFLVALAINIFSSNLLDSQHKIQLLSQKLVQQNVEPLLMAAAAAKMGMWNGNIVTGKLKWSPEQQQLFGFVPGTFGSTYQAFIDCLHPEDKEAVHKGIQEAIQNHSLLYQEFRVVWADGSIHWVEGKGHAFYNEAGEPILMTGTATAIDDRKQTQNLLQQQFERQRLVMEINQRIRTSLNLSETLQITVNEIRRILKTDRVIIFQFNPQWRGTVLVESVGAEWTAILSTEIYDPCFGENYVEPFKQGLITVKSDIYKAEIDPCHVQLLANFQVRANIVVPIIKQNELWGLLIAHHCEAPRQWQTSEIELMRQLAAQVSIAIGQSELFAQLQTELEERKQIEASLRESELRYRSLVHATTQIVWRSDAEGRTIIASDSWEELTGQPAAECLGWGWLSVIHPDDRNRTTQIWIESCTNGTIYETESRLRIKDGTYRDFAVRAVPIFNGDGEIKEWIGICQDITERKQAEIALQQLNAELEARVAQRTAELIEANDRLQEELILSARLQRQVMERERLLGSFFNAASSANIGLAIHDRQFNYVKINQALADINGFPIEAYFGRNVAEILPDLAPQIIPALQKVIDTKEAIRRLEIKGTTPSLPESLHYWLVSHFPIFDETGQVIAIGSLLLDITERKRIEEALKLTHNQLTFHIENTPLATIIWDADFRVKQWSKQAERIFGWSAQEVLGKRMYDWQFIFEADLEKVKLVEENLLNGNKTLCNNRNYHKDGRVIDCEWYNSALLDESGNLVSLLSLAQDVSDRQAALRDRQRAEIDLQQANAELLKRTTQLEELNQELQVTLEELQIIQENLQESYEQLEIALSDSQLHRSRYEDLFNFAPDGYLVTDTNGVIQEANQAAENLFLVSQSSLVGKPLSIYISDQDRTIFRTALNQLTQWFARQRYELTMKPRQGNLFPAAITASTIYDQKTKITGIRWLIKDISEQKKIETALRVSEEKFRQLAENIQAVFWIKDTQTEKIIYLSKAYETIWHRSCESVYQNRLNWLETVHPDDRQRVEFLCCELQNIESFDLEYRIIRPDDSVGWIRDRAFPIANEAGKIIRVAGIAEDITDRKQAEEALQQSEEKFRQLAENIQAVFWIKDAQTHNNLYVSQAYQTIWQRSCESLSQNAFNWLNTIHPDDRQKVESTFFNRKRTEPLQEQYRIIRPDGSIRWIRDRAFPILNEAGEIIRVAGIAEDITEQQQIEQIKNEFIGIVSHELRTPLTAIQMSLGLLKTGVYKNNPEKFQRMLDIALLDTNRLVNLVNDILDLERLESGRVVLEKTICQAVDLIQQAVNGMEALATAQQITLKINSTDVQVWAARDAIVQTLTNLLSNAIKFSPPNSTITLEAKSQMDLVLFQVTDRGRGIPADQLELIFGRFQQVDASDSRDKGGTGLGLAICQSIIQQHGGEIWVESVLGKGSTFFFTLPRNCG